MSERIQAVRGMNDILPQQSYLWRYIEQTFAQCASAYFYQEIRTPLLESTQLFKRTIGDATDIVEKEMYTFQDLNGDSLTLRPEGTAGCVRACLEHGLLHNAQPKLWYAAPMFRHEKPQKGRYRQFIQLGVEAFGMSGTHIELELIAMCKRFFEALGVFENTQLQVNTIGDLSERQAYYHALIEYFTPHIDKLDEDSKRRLHRNPLRILDSKNKDIRHLIDGAPKLLDVIGTESRAHFSSLCDGLDRLGIQYEVNPLLVRGLDYYGHTVFEWVTSQLGSQATVCAGGRFDRLIEQIGGAPTPAVGFAMGLERLALLMEACNLPLIDEPSPDIFIIAMGDDAIQHAFIMAEEIRNHLPRCTIVSPLMNSGFKSQFKRADKSKARLALILGDDEMQHNTVGIKELRVTGEQYTLSQNELVKHLTTYFASNTMNMGDE